MSFNIHTKLEDKSFYLSTKLFSLSCDVMEHTVHISVFNRDPTDDTPITVLSVPRTQEKGIEFKWYREAFSNIGQLYFEDKILVVAIGDDTLALIMFKENRVDLFNFSYSYDFINAKVGEDND